MSFDWEKYWKDTDEPISSTNFAKDMADRFIPLFDSFTVSTFADFGCGPATMILKLAEAYPDTVFYGYDLSEAVIQKNTMKAREQGLDNIFSRKKIFHTQKQEHLLMLFLVFRLFTIWRRLRLR